MKFLGSLGRGGRRMDKATKDYLKVKATEIRVRSGSQKDPEIINIEDELP